MDSPQTSSETDVGLDVKELLKALVAFKQGDFTFRLSFRRRSYETGSG